MCCGNLTFNFVAVDSRRNQARRRPCRWIQLARYRRPGVARIAGDAGVAGFVDEHDAAGAGDERLTVRRLTMSTTLPSSVRPLPTLWGSFYTSVLLYISVSVFFYTSVYM